jgi:hypothetical protein
MPVVAINRRIPVRLQVRTADYIDIAVMGDRTVPGSRFRYRDER